jgi:hypothetical protein
MLDVHKLTLLAQLTLLEELSISVIRALGPHDLQPLTALTRLKKLQWGGRCCNSTAWIQDGMMLQEKMFMLNNTVRPHCQGLHVKAACLNGPPSSRPLLP